MKLCDIWRKEDLKRKRIYMHCLYGLNFLYYLISKITTIISVYFTTKSLIIYWLGTPLIVMLASSSFLKKLWINNTFGRQITLYYLDSKFKKAWRVSSRVLEIKYHGFLRAFRYKSYITLYIYIIIIIFIFI